MAEGTKVGTAYVEVKPKATGDFTSVLDKELGDGKGSSKGNAFGSAFSGGLKGAISAGAVAVGNILSDVIESGASAAKDLVASSMGGFSEYQQLAGGVEKIFDQADTSQILADAQNAFSELNMSANDYLASINQTGAAFAQTMGDQKGYEVARDGMKAISDYASGTGRDLSELNDKYAMITRSTSSYQSIADQFSGILPATSADFLKLAQNAGFLSESYESLTDVPVAEYQQAVTSMLQKGVEDMGLAGNTLAESTETYSGSLAMMQASWENFTASLGNPDVDTTASMKALTDSIGAFLDNALPVFENVVSGIATAIPGLVAELAPVVIPALGNVVESIASALPALVSTLVPVLVPAAVNAVMAVVPAIVALAPNLLQAGMDLFLGLVQAAVVMLPVVAQTVIAAGPTLLAAGMEFFMQLGYALGQAAPAIFDAVVWLVTHLPEIVVQGAFSMLEAGANLFGGFVEGLLGAEPQSTRAGTTVATAGALQYGVALEAATASGQLIECAVGLPAVIKIS